MRIALCLQGLSSGYNEKNNPTRSKEVGERDPKKVGKSTSAYAVNQP